MVKYNLWKSEKKLKDEAISYLERLVYNIFQYYFDSEIFYSQSKFFNSVDQINIQISAFKNSLSSNLIDLIISESSLFVKRYCDILKIDPVIKEETENSLRTLMIFFINKLTRELRTSVELSLISSSDKVEFSESVIDSHTNVFTGKLKTFVSLNLLRAVNYFVYESLVYSDYKDFKIHCFDKAIGCKKISNLVSEEHSFKIKAKELSAKEKRNMLWDKSGGFYEGIPPSRFGSKEIIIPIDIDQNHKLFDVMF